MAIHRRLDSFSLILYLLLILWVKTELRQSLPPITSGFQLLRSLSANKHFCRTSRAAKTLYLSWFFLVDPIISPSPGAGGEIQLTDAMAEYARNCGGMTAVEFTGTHYDMGNKLRVVEAQVELALQHPEIGEAFRAYLKEFCKTL